MVWCAHCQEDCCTIYDHDKGFVCCTGCGRVLDQDVFSDEPTFIKDGSGQSRFAGARMRSAEYSSRERTLQKGRDEISNILHHLQIGGQGVTIDAAHRLYTIAIDKNFTRGRRTSHVAAACLYIYCRSNDKPYLLIDFSDYLMTSVYVLGAVFLQLCNTLRLSEHAIVQQIIDPSLFIHRFADRLVGRRNDEVANTALQIVASMKRDWMQTGRKPSGLCGAAIYISALSHGLNYSKSDIVEEFLTRADNINQVPAPSQLPKPGEVICKHKDEAPHFAHGLCKLCFGELNRISGGLEGGAEPPAFQRAERQRLERDKAQEKASGVVAPAELEALLLTHPKIADAAVIPFPDKDVGQFPMAYIVRKSRRELSENEVMEFVGKQVAPYKIRRVAFVSAIPKNASGKILRKDLIKLATLTSKI